MVLTWNEERNIAACLASLARQRDLDFEVIVVDAASPDGTLRKIEEARATFPVPLILRAAKTKLPIGEARNLGVELARAPIVAFLSADAELDPKWSEAALESMEKADMVFGRQLHEPHAWTLGAAVRGLRYNFPEGPTEDPLRFASNVACAYRKEILQAFPFDPWANAAEDLLLAQRAARAGFVASYDARLIVRHHDVATSREEMRKNVREGEGWGLYRNELGLLPQVLAWGVALLLAAALVIASAFLPWSTWIAVVALAALLWLPALRRAARRRRAMPLWHVARGVLASPAFDLAFLWNYVRGLTARRRSAKSVANPSELQA